MKKITKLLQIVPEILPHIVRTYDKNLYDGNGNLLGGGQGSQGPQGFQGVSGSQGPQGSQGPGGSGVEGLQDVLNVGNTYSGIIEIVGFQSGIVAGSESILSVGSTGIIFNGGGLPDPSTSIFSRSSDSISIVGPGSDGSYSNIYIDVSGLDGNTNMNMKIGLTQTSITNGDSNGNKYQLATFGSQSTSIISDNVFSGYVFPYNTQPGPLCDVLIGMWVGNNVTIIGGTVAVFGYYDSVFAASLIVGVLDHSHVLALNVNDFNSVNKSSLIISTGSFFINSSDIRFFSSDPVNDNYETLLIISTASLSVFMGPSGSAVNRFAVYDDNISLYDYPNTRIDSSIPTNFLYTDVSGNLKSHPIFDRVASIQNVSPLDGDTVYSDGSQYLILNVPSHISTATIVFPGSPLDGQLFTVVSVGDSIGILLWSGGTSSYNQSFILPNSALKYIYNTSLLSWINIT